MADGAESKTTRERILEAGRKTFEKLGAKASMSQIADAAGVSRQTLYLQFGDRIGLLQELVVSTSRQAGMRAMIQALSLPPLEAFEGYFRNWIGTAIRVEPALRPYWREAENDPELLSAVRSTDAAMHKAYIEIFGRLHAARLLRSIWSAQEAADAAYQTTMYGVFAGHLRNMRGWTPDEIVGRGMKVLRATFLTEAAAKRAEAIKT